MKSTGLSPHFKVGGPSDYSSLVTCCFSLLSPALTESPGRSGCEELAAQFQSQEIDGQALLLLREDHLISTMNIKLGPALKICASINSLRE